MRMCVPVGRGELTIEIVRDHARRVKRYSSGEMALRWAAAGLLAQKDLPWADGCSRGTRTFFTCLAGPLGQGLGIVRACLSGDGRVSGSGWM
jgi:hypothetical protein